MTTQNILGYAVTAEQAGSVIADITAHMERPERAFGWMACLNPHSYAVAKSDAAFMSALHQADWLVPDGVGVIIAGRLLGRPLTERITGFDVFDGVMQQLERTGGSVFFLGGTDATLAKIAEQLPQDYPNVTLAGVYSPPFKPSYDEQEIDAMVAAVRGAQPDVLWVGMTAPKQEKWIAELQTRLDVRFAGAIGAVFDFYIGNVKRSHPAFQKLGLEWLPRLLQEPKRLWRRMFVSAPIFLKDVFIERICGPRTR